MGEYFDVKVYVWKRVIESNRIILVFFEEVEECQVGKLEEDEMEVEIVIDFGEDIVKGYVIYQLEILENVVKIIWNI